MQILATTFLTSLRVEVFCDGIGFCMISSHPAGAIRAFARLPGSSEGMEDGKEK